MKLAPNNKGMTLIEVLISVSVLAIVGTGLLTMSVHCLRGWGRGTGNEAANSNVTLAVQKLAIDIREARSATSNSAQTQIVAVFPKMLTDPDTGEQVYDAVLNDPETRTYYVSAGNLICRKGDVITTVARGISANSVLTASGAAVDVTLKSIPPAGTSAVTQQATAHISLRNHH